MIPRQVGNQRSQPKLARNGFNQPSHRTKQIAIAQGGEFFISARSISPAGHWPVKIRPSVLLLAISGNDRRDDDGGPGQNPCDATQRCHGTKAWLVEIDQQVKTAAEKQDASYQ